MPYMTWNVWKRSDGCVKWMDRTKFGDTSFSTIFFDAMRMMFFDEAGHPGLLPRGLIFAASQKVVVANGRRNGFSPHDQETMLKDGIFKYSSSNTAFIINDQLEIQGPEANKLGDATNMGEAPIGGEYVYLHFYNLIRMATEGSGPFQKSGPVPHTAAGNRLLSAVTGAVVLHEVTHNHGFNHPKEANWTPGSDYACTMPHVAYRSALDAAMADLGTVGAALSIVQSAACGTNDGTAGKGPPPPPPPPPPPVAHLYNAVFEAGDGRYMMRGWAQNDLEKETVNKAGQGYRLSDQVRYEDKPGQPRYDVVFKPAAGGEHKAVWSYDLGSLKQFDASLYVKGLVLLHQLSYPTLQGRRYDALFATRPGDRQIVWGWTVTDLEAQQKKLEAAGFYLHHQHSYDIGGGERRYDAIFLQMNQAEAALHNNGRSLVFHGLTFDLVQQRIGAAAIFVASSLHHIQSYVVPGKGTLYDIILRPGPRTNVLRLTGDQLAKAEGEQWGKGFRTMQVDRL